MRIEGKNAVTEALRAGKAVYKIKIAKEANQALFVGVVALAKKANIKLEYVERKDLDLLSQAQHHQGIIAEMEDFDYVGVSDILALAAKQGEAPFVIILDGIEDPHNLGSIIRVCDCAGVHGVVLPKHNACPINETVAKVSAGAIGHVKVARVTNLNNAIEELKKAGVWVYAAELGGDDLYSQNLTGALGLVIGSEGKGVHALTKKLCDGVLTLPMLGKVNSLNASVACGVVAFEAVRQRRKLK